MLLLLVKQKFLANNGFESLTEFFVSYDTYQIKIKNSI